MKHVTLGESKSLAGILTSHARLIQAQTTKSSGSIVTHNEDGSKTILGRAAGSAGVAQWVGDTTAPGVPMGLTVSSSLGVVTVTWDGTLEGGVPADFAFITVTATDGFLSFQQQLTVAGSLVFDQFPPGSTVTVSATASDAARDESGEFARNTSAASEPISVVVESAVSQEEIDKIQNDLAANATVLTTLQSDLSTARSTLDAHESTMASLQTDLSAAESTLDRVQDDLAANATVLTTLQSDLSTAKSTLGAHESTMASLQTDLSAAKGTLTSLQSDLGSARSDLATVQTDLAQAKSDIAAAEASMNDLTTTVSSVDGKATTSGSAPTADDAAGKPEGAMWYVMDASGNLTGTYILKSGTWVEYAWGSSSIADAAITNAKIANLDAGKITSGYVDAARIAANSITADKLLVGGGGDYSPNPTFDPSGPLLGTPHSWIPGNGGHSVQLTGRDNVFPESTAFPVAKGDTFYITCEAAHTAGTAPLSLGLWWTVNPSNATSISPWTNLTTATDLGWSANNSDWHTYAATITVPTASDAVVTAARGYIHMLVDLPGAETSAQNTWLIGNYRIYKVSDGTLIADGSISTNKLAANAVTADKLAANSVTAGKIVAGAIGTDQLAANAVTAEKIVAGAIGAYQIAGNSVHADHLVAGAVTTEKIVAGAVGADKIAGNSIHADHLVANSVTADKLAANAVTAGKITAGAVGAYEIAGNSVHASHLVANSVTAEKIVSGAIGTDKLAANSVNAEKIVSDAITADKLAANAVTGVKIASRAITTDKLAAGAITTAKLSGTAIDGMTVTGATVQTSTTAASTGGVVLDSAGLRAYDSAGAVTVDIDAESGDATITGQVQTAKSGNRVVIATEAYESEASSGSDGLVYFYSANDAQTPSYLRVENSEAFADNATKAGYRYTTLQVVGGVATDGQSSNVPDAGLYVTRGWSKNASQDYYTTSEARLGAQNVYLEGEVQWVGGVPHVVCKTLADLTASSWPVRLRSSEFAWNYAIYGRVWGDSTAANNGDYVWSGTAWRRRGSKVLFNNNSQPLQGAVTLSETAANWDALTICFRSDDNDFGSVDVVNPNGKRVALNMTSYNGASMFLKTKIVLINGTTIDTAKNGTAWRTAQVQPDGSNSISAGDFLGITQVIGYSIT